MKFSEAVLELARRFDKITSGNIEQKFKDLAKPEINLAYLDVGKSWRWPHLETYGSILAVPIDSGTVTITKDAQTVTIASAQSVWQGRYFRKKGGENDYRILNVDSNVLTLEQPIVEDSGSIDYEIEKRFYTLPTEVREIAPYDARQSNILNSDNRGLRSTSPNYSTNIIDIPFHIHGVDKFTDDYTTGFASSTKDSVVVIGSGGTAWLSNALAGDIFIFGGTEYRIRRVETDTRIILYNFVGSAISSQSYTIKRGEAMTVRLRGEFLKKKVIPFNYIRSVYDLVHDNDRFDLSREAIVAVLAFSEAHLAKPLGKDDWANRLIEAQGRLSVAHALARPVNRAYSQLSPLVPRGMGRN